MAKAILTKNVPSIAGRRKKEKDRIDKATAFRGKKWRNLTPEQKDNLLKAIATRLGLLDTEDDDDGVADEAPAQETPAAPTPESEATDPQEPKPPKPPKS